MSAISAIDMALWDIKAKAANMPLYQLLGGASREGVMVYCHTTGRTIDEVLEDYAKHQQMGFKAIRVQCGVPGMQTTYGLAKGKGLAYEPATKGLWPEEQLWSSEKYLDFTPKLFEAVRNKFGFNEHLLHDMHHRLTPIEAARFGRSIEDYRLFWMEDPTPAENQECFRLIRQHTVTPIAVGEVFNSIWDCKQLIEEQLIDYIRTTITHAGGITGMRRIADFASLYQVRTGSHGPSDLSLKVICTQAMNRGWVFLSMRNWRRNIRMTRRISPSHDWKMAHCGTGNSGSLNYFLNIHQID